MSTGGHVQHILLVDDDPDLLNLMAHALGRASYRITTATDGAQALTCWEARQPDLVLLDGTLPKVDGFDVCHRIKEQAGTPVILLTARGEEADVVQGLHLGADDYVTKPFSPRQLLARIEAVLRRYRHHRVGHVLRVGDLVLNRETHTVSRAGREVPLTPLEFRLLDPLMTNAGQVVPNARLLEYSASLGRGAAGPATLRTHISHLRSKLGLPASGPGSIQVVPGVGYLVVRRQP